MVETGEKDNSKQVDDNNSDHLKTFQYRETAVLTSFSGILFAFLLRIATTLPKDSTIFTRIVLLMALYCSCIAICSFIMPILSTKLHIYSHMDLQKYIRRTETSMRIGSIAAIVSVFLGLGIALNGLLDIEVAYILAALPFIIIGFVIWRK
ncbi:MAG TPA: hypothetical protein VIY08_02800 [Candidatus Nitrosocosmicus sp.]